MSGYVSGMSGYARMYPHIEGVVVHIHLLWRVCRSYFWGCRWYVRVYLYPRGVLLHKKHVLAGMPEICLGMSGYVRVCSGVSLTPRSFIAQKQILAGMPEVCLGMSVVCPGMPGCIRSMSGYVCWCYSRCQFKASVVAFSSRLRAASTSVSKFPKVPSLLIWLTHLSL